MSERRGKTIGIHAARFGKKKTIAYFYETDAVLKRTGGFPDREAATVAAREYAKQMKAVPKPPIVGRILVGQNTEQPTRR